MAQIAPLINGKRHAWASVRIDMLGRTVDGITSIEYNDSVEKQDNYGAGQFPNNRGVGRYTATAKIKIYNFEINALQKAIAGGRLQAIPMFDIVVTYLPEGTDDVVKDVIKNCEFKTNGRTANEGDMLLEQEFELITSHIIWDGQMEF